MRDLPTRAERIVGKIPTGEAKDLVEFLVEAVRGNQ